MNSRLTTAVAFKLFSIWLIVQMILHIPMVWQLFYMTIDYHSPSKVTNAYPYLILISLAFCGGLAAIIIFKLGNNVIDQIPDEQNSNLNLIDLEILLLQLLGVFFVVTSIAYLPNITFSTYKTIVREETVYWARVISQLSELSLGLFLIAKPKVFQSILKKRR